jgi:hypothetical protein
MLVCWLHQYDVSLLYTVDIEQLYVVLGMLEMQCFICLCHKRSDCWIGESPCQMYEHLVLLLLL